MYVLKKAWAGSQGLCLHTGGQCVSGPRQHTSDMKHTNCVPAGHGGVGGRSGKGGRGMMTLPGCSESLADVLWKEKSKADFEEQVCFLSLAIQNPSFGWPKKDVRFPPVRLINLK